jgi:phosphosulfolactate synthase (CoM biosynthesis protein A)
MLWSIAECQKLGFDIIEISAGFISLSTDDWMRLIELVRKSGLKPKPEVGVQFGAGGATAAAELQAEGTRDRTGRSPRQSDFSKPEQKSS